MKKTIISFILFMFTAFLFATDVSGNQSGTWDMAGSPYNIVGEITVPNGETLTIEAGVEVVAMGNYKLTAEGNINAQGAVGDTIRFFGNGGLDWGGIRLEDETNPSSFSYCRISNTDDINDYGIHSVNSPVYVSYCHIDDHQKGVQFSALSSNNPSYMEITHSKITNIQKSGITVVDNSNVLIDNCEVSYCALGGSPYGAVQLSLQSNSHSCSPTITNNYIHHNDMQGITLANLFGYDNMAPTVEYNEVCYNYTGIYLYAGNGTYTWNHIHHNFVENNADSGAGVMLYGSSANAVFTYNEIDHNYTGFYLTNGATANLGDLSNTDPSDDGYNCIYDNIFFTGEEFTVYNASSEDVTAENTVWDDDPPIDVTIIDGNDNPSYGIVDYEPTLSPFAPPAGINAVVNNGFVSISIEPGTAYPTYKIPFSYNIYRDGSLIANATSLFFIDPLPAIPGTSINYGASIVYEGGYESTLTDTTIFIPHILNPPQNAIVSPIGLMTWDAPEPGSTSNFLNYNVFLDGTLVGTPTGPPWQFTGLTPGQPYLAEVSAVYEDGESDPVEAVWEPIDHDPPLNAGYEVFSDHIHLYWEEPNQYVEEYHIYVDGVMSTTTELFFDISDLIPGQIYEVAITAFYIDQIESDPIIFNIAFVGSGDILNLETKLLGNYPNPFNPSTTISFSVTQSSDFAAIEIYNLKGQIVKTLPVILSDTQHCIEGTGTQNKYSIVWNGKDDSGNSVSSGVYFYRLIYDGENIDSKKMILLK